jgi:hypothetical protein
MNFLFANNQTAILFIQVKFLATNYLQKGNLSFFYFKKLLKKIKSFLPLLKK